jgi:Aminotransferase class-V
VVAIYDPLAERITVLSLTIARTKEAGGDVKGITMITRRRLVGAAARGAILAGTGPMAFRSSLSEAEAPATEPDLSARVRHDFWPERFTANRWCLDSAASAQKPEARAESHPAATEVYEGAREKVRAFANAARPEEIIFAPNATEAINLVAYTFGRERVKPADEIALHHGAPLQHRAGNFLRERQRAVIRWAPVNEEGNFLLDEFKRLPTDRTRMVAITDMSNVLGTVVPVKDVVRMAHERSIPVHVDGAPGRRPP